MTHQTVPTRTYAAVFATLLVLTVVTVAVSKLDLGELNLISAMTIAVTKAALVFWFFMDVRRSSSLTKLVVFAGLLWLAIMMFFMLSDYMSRGWMPILKWW